MGRHDAPAISLRGTAVDVALAVGSEKLKDTGYGGLPVQTKGTLNDLWLPMGSAPAGFAQLAAGYRARYNVDRDDLKRAIGFGVSQSGRYLRTYLYYGFNQDEKGRMVLDGTYDTLLADDRVRRSYLGLTDA